MFNDRPKCRSPGSPSPDPAGQLFTGSEGMEPFLYKTGSGPMPEEGPRVLPSIWNVVKQPRGGNLTEGFSEAGNS